MKFTLSWLKDHLQTDVALDDLVLGLTDLGLEVDSVIDPAKKVAHLTVGEIVRVEQHPNADRLKVCEVNIGDSSKQIICGAINARAGIKVVVAQPGDYVPGIDTIIKVGNIRGVESHGMMCSERELMLSEEHDGIIELDSKACVGAKYVDQCNDLDVVVDIAITPNRPDALGVRGVARDLAAKGLGEFKQRNVSRINGTFKSPVSIKIAEEVLTKDCPLFVGRHIRGVVNRQSPKWLQDRLTAIGLRPISALVDITNFVTYDSARPLHVFDVAKLGGCLTVRKALFGESMLALDGLEYNLGPDDTVISSGQIVESIAGIIGGMNSGCELNTTEVLVESAYFDPISTAKTGRKLKINSDARYRFERGVDPLFVEKGIDFASKLILDICGGELSEVIVVGTPPFVDKVVELRPDRVNSLVGITIPKEEQERILRALGFVVLHKSSTFQVKVPSWRPDVFGEADLIEEIVRVTSLSKLEGAPLKQTHVGVIKPVFTPFQKRVSRLRRKIVSLGLNECISYSFIDKKSAKLFSKGIKSIKLLNPISSEMTHMRPSIIPGLLQAAKRNQSRSYNDLKLFELGEVFFGNKPGEQRTNVAGILVGKYLPKNSYSQLRDVDAFDVKKIVESALDNMFVIPDRLLIVRDEIEDFYHPGRAGKLCLGPNNVLATFGELHPKILKHYDLKGPVVLFEIFMDAVPFPKKRKLIRPPIKISEFQPVERDFAFVVAVNCEVESIKKAILASEKELIIEARIFDIFEGEEAERQLGSGKKSVAFMVKLQPLDATFTDNDLETVSQKIIKSVQNATGASLRSKP